MLTVVKEWHEAINSVLDAVEALLAVASDAPTAGRHGPRNGGVGGMYLQAELEYWREPASDEHPELGCTIDLIRGRDLSGWRTVGSGLVASFSIDGLDGKPIALVRMAVADDAESARRFAVTCEALAHSLTGQLTNQLGGGIA